jgi:hypothetical protein
LLAIELGHGVLCIGLRGHRHKGESPGFAREFILHEEHFGDCAGLRKHVLQLELRRRERQVAYVQSISHNGLDFRFRRLTVPCGEYGAEVTPMTDPAEPDLFCAMIGMQSRQINRAKSIENYVGPTPTNGARMAV